MPNWPSGPTSSSSRERARRQAGLQQVEATFEPLPFEVTAARSYGLVVAAVTATGHTHRRRVADLLIAATAHANGLPLYTRNSGDLAGLSDLIEVIGI
jgi:predicted nucleic acid-binding protein